MKYPIKTVEDLGVLIRAARKVSGIRIDDLASSAGVSKQFMGDLELGKPGVQLGKVLKTLHELGIYLSADVPSGTQELIDHSKSLIERTNTRRRNTPRAGTGNVKGTPNV